jgi:hypothetical protein
MFKKNKKEQNLERERKILKETLEIVIQQNSELKETLSEIQSNVNENKIQLKEKVNTITNKDTAVEMLSNQIEQLKQKFYDLQLKQKMQSLLNNNISEDIIISKGNETNNNTNPHTNQLMKINVKEEQIIKEQENQMKTVEDRIEKQKNFFEKQQEILNEITNLKRDVKFLQEKINENKSKYIIYQYNCDIQNYFKNNDLMNIKKILNKNPKDNLIYFVTINGNVYKIKRRDDLQKNNFLSKINLDFISTDRENEIINIREKIKNEKIDNDYPRILTLSNNKFNNNIGNIIRCTRNPNFFYEKKNINKINNIESSQQIIRDNNTSRNNPRPKKINSYVTELLKNSFVL